MLKKIYDTDDLIEAGNYNNYHVILKIKNLSEKLWCLLKNINEHLYHENTNIILKHKPIFDIEKKKLIKIDCYIEGLYKIGLISKLSTISKIKILDNNYFNQDTYSIEWNDLAKEINKKIIDLNNMIKKEQRLEKFIKDNNSNIMNTSMCNAVCVNIFLISIFSLVVGIPFLYNYISL